MEHIPNLDNRQTLKSYSKRSKVIKICETDVLKNALYSAMYA